MQVSSSRANTRAHIGRRPVGHGQHQNLSSCHRYVDSVAAAQADVAASSVDRRSALALVVASTAAATFGTLPAVADDCALSSAVSGLQFCDITEGSGPEAEPGTLIRAHYSGSLLSNGKQFDSSYARGRPLTFRVAAGEVIKGWDVGIAGGDGVPAMKAGGKRKLVIPADLGYGQRGAGGVIPPGATLVFDVEYLGPATARR